jgi:hypothetical protein
MPVLLLYTTPFFPETLAPERDISKHSTAKAEKPPRKPGKTQFLSQLKTRQTDW